MFLRREQLLTFEEIERLARLFLAAGVNKIRLTGGEPLLRRDLETLVSMLSALRPHGLADLTLTTNGALLPAKAQALRDAGLDRVTVSLDSLDDDVFQSMNDVALPGRPRARGHRGRRSRPVSPSRSTWSSSATSTTARSWTWPSASAAPASSCASSSSWTSAPPTAGAWTTSCPPRSWSTSCRPAGRSSRSRRATRARSPTAYRYLDGAGEIGVIASVTQPFCGDCTRARLSAEGELYTCLFAAHGRDLRAPLRDGATDEQLAALLGRIWGDRGDRYSELRSAETRDRPRVEMSHIGG